MRPLTCSAAAPNMHRQPAAQAAGMPSSNKARMLFPSAPASSCADKRPLPRPYSIVNKKMHTGPTADRPSKNSSVAAAARAAYSAQNSPAADGVAEIEKSAHQCCRKYLSISCCEASQTACRLPAAAVPMRKAAASRQQSRLAACGGAAVPVAVRRHPALLLRRSGAPEPVASGHRTLPGAAAEAP